MEAIQNISISYFQDTIVKCIWLLKYFLGLKPSFDANNDEFDQTRKIVFWKKLCKLTNDGTKFIFELKSRWHISFIRNFFLGHWKFQLEKKKKNRKRSSYFFDLNTLEIVWLISKRKTS